MERTPKISYSRIHIPFIVKCCFSLGSMLVKLWYFLRKESLSSDMLNQHTLWIDSNQNFKALVGLRTTPDLENEFENMKQKVTHFQNMHRPWSIRSTPLLLLSRVCYSQRNCPYFKWFFGILTLKTFANKPTAGGGGGMLNDAFCQVVSSQH